MTEWTDSQVSMLRQLWTDKVTASQIGLDLGHSRNSVCGKARRLGLAPRPSPIKLNGRKPKKYKRTKIKKPRPSRAKPKLPASVIPVRLGPVRCCAWLNGKRFAYVACGAPTLPGDPYCEMHHRICYTVTPKATGRPFELPK